MIFSNASQLARHHAERAEYLLLALDEIEHTPAEDLALATQAQAHALLAQAGLMDWYGSKAKDYRG